MTDISRFADEHGLKLRFGRTTSGGWFVAFRHCEVKRGPILEGATGFGSTPREALSFYCRGIAGQTLVRGAYTSERTVIQCPPELEPDEAALAASLEGEEPSEEPHSMTTPDPTDRFFAPADDLVTRLASRESRAHAEAMIAEELTAAYAAGQAEALAWRPIETAPRDDPFVHGSRDVEPWQNPCRVLMPHERHPTSGWWCGPLQPLPPAAEPAREDVA